MGYYVVEEDMYVTYPSNALWGRPGDVLELDMDSEYVRQIFRSQHHKIREATDADLKAKRPRPLSGPYMAEYQRLMRERVNDRMVRAEAEWLSVKDAADRFGVTTQAIYKAMKKGRVHRDRRKIGGRTKTVVPAEEVGALRGSA